MQRILFIKKFSSKYFCQELNNRLSFYTLICRKKFSGGDFMIMIIIVECVDDDHRSEGHSGGLLAQHAIWGILDIFLWKTQQISSICMWKNTTNILDIFLWKKQQISWIFPVEKNNKYPQYLLVAKLKKWRTPSWIFPVEKSKYPSKFSMENGNNYRSACNIQHVQNITASFTYSSK